MKILSTFLTSLGLLSFCSFLYASNANNTISCPATALTNCQSSGGETKCSGDYQNGAQKTPYSVTGYNLNLLDSLQAGQLTSSGNVEACIYPDPLYPLPAIGLISE
jgi:hypothetical protein